MDVAKAIIPAAGFGTRFLPFTKAIPKEMLPLMNKPAIQFVVEEALQAGINFFTIVTSKHKQAIADHFDASHDLEYLLKEHNKLELTATIDQIIRSSHFNYVRQAEPLGLGHAVWMARHMIGKEYFAILLPDEIILNKTSALNQLINTARQEKASVIAVQEVPLDSVCNYGIIEVRKQINPHLFQVGSLVEKPDQKNAPSNLAIVGRYILSHKIFSSIEEISSSGSTDEIQLTDAIAHMLRNNEKVFAFKIRGTRYDIGNPLGWLKATIGCALQNPVYRPHLKKFIDELENPELFSLGSGKNMFDQAEE